MRRKFVDLSIYLENEVLSDPPPLAPKIEYQRHKDTVPELLRMPSGPYLRPPVLRHQWAFSGAVKLPVNAARLRDGAKAIAFQRSLRASGAGPAVPQSARPVAVMQFRVSR